MVGTSTWEYVGCPSDEEIQQFIKMTTDYAIKNPDLLSKEENEEVMEVHLILSAYVVFQLYRGKTKRDMIDFLIQKDVPPWIVQFIMSMATVPDSQKITRFTYAVHAFLSACRHMPKAFLSEENLYIFAKAGMQRNFKNTARMSGEGVPDLQILEGVMWHQIPPELDVTHELPSGSDVWEAISVDRLNFCADAFVVICTRVMAYIGNEQSPEKIIEYLTAEEIPKDVAEKIVRHVVPNLLKEAHNDYLLQSAQTPKQEFKHKRTILIVCLIVMIVLWFSALLSK
jgi:hypothetical protein